jgi:glycosyltransferase involved in cell wall biosynthesis
MRIGLLTTSFPRYEGDVAGAFVLGFAKALAKLGHEIEVLAPEPREHDAPPSWPGVQVVWVPYIRPRALARTFYGAGVPDNLRSDARAWLGIAPFTAALLTQVLRRRTRWDALVSHWGLPCGLVAGALRQAKPHLCVMHSADLHVLSRMPLRARLAARLSAGASALHFVSAKQRDQFLAWLGPRVDRGERISHVQPMGIDDPGPISKDRTALRRELGLHHFTLLTIGRLVPVKGLEEALVALGDRCDLHWLIAGDGPERSRLTELGRRARIDVRMLGTVAGDHKRALLHAADAFVLPSRVLPSGRSEGVPTAILEAMASGLPVIASDVGGIRQVVRHLDNGLLCDARDPRALEQNVDRLMADAGLRAILTASARSEAERHHWTELAPRLQSMLIA